MQCGPYLFAARERPATILVIVRGGRQPLIPQKLAACGCDRRPDRRGWPGENQVLAVRVVAEVEALACMARPELRCVSSHRHGHGLQTFQIREACALAFQRRRHVVFERHDGHERQQTFAGAQPQRRRERDLHAVLGFDAVLAFDEELLRLAGSTLYLIAVSLNEELADLACDTSLAGTPAQVAGARDDPHMLLWMQAVQAH